jgi:hypothetical protein
MVNRNSEAERLHRFGLIISTIRQCNERGADKEKLIASFMVEYGIARRTLLEYIQALKLSEKVIEEAGILFMRQQTLLSEDEEKILNAVF